MTENPPSNSKLRFTQVFLPIGSRHLPVDTGTITVSGTDVARRIVAEGNLTTLMVTHNMAQALSIGNRLIMMHEGRIIYSADAVTKAQLTVEDLMAESAKIKGVSDHTLLH